MECDHCDLQQVEIDQLTEEAENIKYELDDAMESNSKLEDKNFDLEREIEDLKRNVDDLEKEIAEEGGRAEDLETDLEAMTAERDETQTKYDNLISYLEDMWPEAITDLTIRGDI